MSVSAPDLEASIRFYTEEASSLDRAVVPDIPRLVDVVAQDEEGLAARLYTRGPGRDVHQPLGKS